MTLFIFVSDETESNIFDSVVVVLIVLMYRK